ncbi:MAG: c-type cytochrome [Bacteroidetes bacterium]|nr:c-type cytochrome [Bacteroidota bacterium]
MKFSISFLLIALFFLNTNAQKQRWDVPADKKAKNSYIKFDNASSKDGEAIYTKNCLSCHGNPGKGNSMKTLKPIPPDLYSSLTQELTDGELFYIISVGRLVMPAFKDILSEEDRWKLISYVRSGNKKYVQVLSKTDPNKSKLVKIKLDFDSLTNKIKVIANAAEKTGIIPLKDAEVSLFAKRYFGKLQIEKTIRTNSEGIVIFNFPKDLPGDKAGLVDLSVKINDEVYGEIEFQNKLKVGIPTDKPSLTEKRAIWNVLKKAPIWLIITYTSLVFLVGFVLLFIVKNLMKLRKLGNN